MTDSPGMTSACLDWWEGLRDHPGDRARLRRGGRIDDALMIPSTHRLADRARPFGFVSIRRVALLASIAAQAKACDVDGATLPARLGTKIGEREAFSETRFRRLLQAADEDGLLLHLRRAIRILDDRVHLPSLIEASRYWSFNPDKSTSILTRWACAYYGTVPANKSA